MKDITEILLEKDEGQLKAIASEYEVPRFKNKNKKELVNEVELLMKSPDFKERVKEKLSIPMINLLNLIMESKNHCRNLDSLKDEFPKYMATELTFESLINQLLSLGIIHRIEEDGKIGLCIPFEVHKWLKQFRRKKISEI